MDEVAGLDVEHAAERVTVAILNYDGCDLLDIVVPSVLAQRHRGRVVVVDNGSRDGSAEHVKEHWPAVEVIRIPENIGVAAALNRAVAAGDTEYLALLNNDIELEPDWLGELVAALDTHPEAAAASGKLLRYHEREIIDSAGDLLLWSSAVLNRGAGERDRGQFDEPGRVFAACAGAALYRRSAFELVGGFDESFFAYAEDIDWGTRAQLLGLSARYTPTAIGYHVGGATTGKRPRLYIRCQRRNQLTLAIKSFPTSALLRHGWKIVVNQLLTLAASVRDRTLMALLHGWFDVLVRLPATLRARRKIQRSRVVGTRELDALISASLPTGGSRLRRLLFELAPQAASRSRSERS
ncbi:MAG: glycosyltransferase family 2 protein [Gaiellales bacterium]